MALLCVSLLPVLHPWFPVTEAPWATVPCEESEGFRGLQAGERSEGAGLEAEGRWGFTVLGLSRAVQDGER